MKTEHDFHHYLRYGFQNDLRQEAIENLRKLSNPLPLDNYPTSFFKKAVARIVETIPTASPGYVHHFASRMILQLTNPQYDMLKLSLEALIKVLEPFKGNLDYSAHDAVADTDIRDALNLENKEEYNYDPETCISAKEIRDMGIFVPVNIPDEAWIKRRDMCIEPISLDTPDENRGQSYSFNTTLRVTFTAPFKWIEVNATVSKPE